MVSAHEKDEYSPQHSGVHSLSFSPDGKLLASGGTNDSLVKLWDVSSGKQVATLTGDNRGSIASVVFSLDGRLLAALGGDGRVELWDMSSGKQVASISAHEMINRHGLSFSSDGRLLASAGSRLSPPGARLDEVEAEEDTEVKLWDVSSGKQVATLTGGGPVSFSPNGGLLASASAVKIRWVPHGDGGAGGESSGGQEIKLWDVSTGESIATLLLSDITFGYPTNMMVFSPDGRLLASSTHRTVAAMGRV